MTLFHYLLISDLFEQVFERWLSALEHQDVERTHPGLGEQFGAEAEDIGGELGCAQLLGHNLAGLGVFGQASLVQRCSALGTGLRGQRFPEKSKL